MCLPIAIAACTNASATTAGPANQVKPLPTGPDVVVEGANAKAVEALVTVLTQTDHGNYAQVARWDRAICPRALGLQPEQAALVIADIIKAAQLAGLRSQHRCQANVIVVVTSDAHGFAAELVSRHPALFRPSEDGIAPRSERDALVRSDAPVRMIVASQPGNAGNPDPTSIGGTVSRLQFNSVNRLSAAVSIVDATRLNGVTWQQLSDYLALASLTRADMNAAYGPNTILSLFQAIAKGEKAPPGLTTLDKAFLKSLYSVNGTLPADAQRLSIKRGIEYKLRASPTAP